jgi:hypothetical protein
VVVAAFQLPITQSVFCVAGIAVMRRRGFRNVNGL